MPSIGFSVFKEKVKDGRKRQTIRKVGKRTIRPGDTLFLYWHLRKKDCELLKIVRCLEVLKLPYQAFAWDDGMARADGFETSEELRALFRRMHKPKMGDMFYIIRW